MPEFNFLKYTIKIDKQTKAVQDVKQELKGVEQQTGNIGTTARQSAKGFSLMGTAMKAVPLLALAAVVATFTRQAFKGSDALQQVGSEMLSMVSTITKELEPAFRILARIIKGVSAGLTGLVKIIVTQIKGSFSALTKLLKGDFKGAFEDIKNTIAKNMKLGLDAGKKALEGFRGESKIIMKQTVDNMLSEMVRNLKDTSLTGDEKLDIIKENEHKLLALLKQTGDFRQGDNDTQTAMLETFNRVFATEKEAAQRESLRVQGEFARAQTDLLRLGLEDESLIAEERLELMGEIFEREKEQIIAQGAAKMLDKATIDLLIEIAEKKHLLKLAEMGKTSDVDERKADLKAAADKLGIKMGTLEKIQNLQEKFGNILIREAAKAEGNIRDLARRAGADAVKLAAQIASKKIQMAAIDLGWDAARKFGFPGGFLLMAGIIAAGTAAAAGVAALGGAAAAAIGGSTAAPAIPEASPLREPAPVNPVGGGFDGDDVAGPPPGLEEEEVGPRVVVNISSMGIIPEEVIADISEKVAEAAS